MRRILISSLLLALTSPPALALPAAQLQPHRAVYSLKLANADAGSGVVSAEGAMIFEWAESCEGWTIQQKALFDVYGPEGGGVRTEVNFSSWEDKKGTDYRFTVRTTQNGKVVEDLRGEARMSPGEGGTATYTRPQPRTAELPADTLFSGGHTLLLIEKAMEGETVVLRPVFLGQREDEPMMVNAVISAKHQSGDVRPEWKDLLGGAYWDTNLAFYGDEDQTTPAFEVREKLHANGIVADATVAYDTFSFHYALTKLEALPRPSC